MNCTRRAVAFTPRASMLWPGPTNTTKSDPSPITTPNTRRFSKIPEIIQVGEFIFGSFHVFLLLFLLLLLFNIFVCVFLLFYPFFVFFLSSFSVSFCSTYSSSPFHADQWQLAVLVFEQADFIVWNSWCHTVSHWATVATRN